MDAFGTSKRGFLKCDALRHMPQVIFRNKANINELILEILIVFSENTGKSIK